MSTTLVASWQHVPTGREVEVRRIKRLFRKPRYVTACTRCGPLGPEHADLTPAWDESLEHNCSGPGEWEFHRA